MRDRPALPVGGVDEPVVAVDRPPVGDRAVEEFHRRVEVAGRPDRGALRDQPCPLHAVPDGRAVGQELVVGAVAVVLGQGGPRAVEVLADPSPPLAGHLDGEPAQRDGAGAQALVVQGVAGGEEGLGEVHVGVQAAVGRRAPVAVDPVQPAAVPGLPEGRLEPVEGAVQHRGAAPVPDRRAGRGGEDDERERVEALRLVGAAEGVLGPPVRGERGEVVQQRERGRPRAGLAAQRGERVDVGEAGGAERRRDGVGQRGAVGGEDGRVAALADDADREAEQPALLAAQPLPVVRAVQPAQRRPTGCRVRHAGQHAATAASRTVGPTGLRGADTGAPSVFGDGGPVAVLRR